MSKLSTIKERNSNYEKKLEKCERDLLRSKQTIYNMKRYIETYDIKNKKGSKKKKNNKKTKNNKCRKCRCKPCKCDKDIHCYQIMTTERYKRSKKYKKYNKKGNPPKLTKRKSKRSRKR